MMSIFIAVIDTELYIFRSHCKCELLSHVGGLLSASHEVVRGLMEAQDEEVMEEGINYVAMRNLFVREASESVNVRVEKRTRTTHIRESAGRLVLNRTVNPHFFVNLQQGCVHFPKIIRSLT